LQITLTEKGGEAITRHISRPFYVGFVRRDPSLLLHIDSRTAFSPGEVLVGEVELGSKGHGIEEHSVLRIGFVTESEKMHEIVVAPARDLLKGPVQFHWVVPSLETDVLLDRAGRIHASLSEGKNEISVADSERFRIADLDVKIDIDSLRVPTRATPGGKISGWLRIRRSTELGDPSQLAISLRYPSEREVVVSRQSVKQSRNLSLAFGPLAIPEEVSSEDIDRITIIARISYAGREMDQKSADIRITPVAEANLVDMRFVGVQGFLEPGITTHSALEIAAARDYSGQCDLIVEMESAVGSEKLLEKSIDITPNDEKLFPLEFSMPLASEMSTAYLKAMARCGDRIHEIQEKLKVKAIERPILAVKYRIIDEFGNEIPGLVPRVTSVSFIIHAKFGEVKPGNYSLRFQVMSRRDIVGEFDLSVEELMQDGGVAEIIWKTPLVDMVAAFYVRSILLESGHELPDRALEQEEKQFTVY
ncbi:MAG: hypothetical protein ACFE7R_04625, partial [Candidatus Hodarchaeota archaeon]